MDELGGGVAATRTGFGEDLIVCSTGDGRDFFMAPVRLIPRPLLTGLKMRSAGPTWELLPSPLSWRTRSLAARLSLLRSRMPLALPSLLNEPDQLPLDSEARETW